MSCWVHRVVGLTLCRLQVKPLGPSYLPLLRYSNEPLCKALTACVDSLLRRVEVPHDVGGHGGGGGGLEERGGVVETDLGGGVGWRGRRRREGSLLLGLEGGARRSLGNFGLFRWLGLSCCQFGLPTHLFLHNPRPRLLDLLGSVWAEEHHVDILVLSTLLFVLISDIGRG